MPLPELTAYWDYLSFHTMPVSGGSREQDPDTLRAFRIIHHAIADWQKAEQRKQKRMSRG